LIEEYPQPKQVAKKEGLNKEEFKQRQAQQRRPMLEAREWLRSRQTRNRTQPNGKAADNSGENGSTERRSAR